MVKVGRLEVGPGVLGYGSGGTIVFEGKLDGRSVAVRRFSARPSKKICVDSLFNLRC